MELRETLIEEHIATATQVDEAIARQVLYGLDVVTNLLELTPVDERRVHHALGKAFALPTAPPGELPYASASAIGLVPKETAVSLGIYPYRLDDGVLTVVSCEPLRAEAVEALAFALQVRVRGTLALGPRVKQAIARDYAFTLDRRTQKAIAKLEKRPTSQSSRAPQAFTDGPSMSELPRPISVVPIGFPMSWAEAQTPAGRELLAETTRQPEVQLRHQLAGDLTAEAPRSSRSLLQPEPTNEVSHLEPGSHHRRGPYTAAQAKRDLKHPAHARRVLDVYFNFAAQYFDHSAVFTLHGAQVELRDARALPHATLGGARVPLSTLGTLESIASTRRWLSVHLQDSGVLGALLGFESTHSGIALPVCVHDHCVMLLFGAFTKTSVELSDVGEILAFEALVAQALEQLILQKKARSPTRRLAGKLPSAPAPAPRFEPPPAADRARALTQVLTGADESAPSARRGDALPAPAHVAATPLLVDAASRLVTVRAADDSGAPPIKSSPRPWTLSSQPPGNYGDDDSARDSGWDFDLEQ
ncbi:MAG: hypothetical protein RJA70_3983 [Pseudomonadota bacterium]|jgi:hypothetical protein